MKKGLRIVAIVLIIFSVIVNGNPVSKNDNMINIAVAIVGIIFSSYLLIKQKNIVITKQNIVIFILCISSAIPLLFKSYVSLSNTVFYIFRYISIFVIYQLIVYLIKEDKNNKEYIKKTIIFSGVILVLFGIDLMTTEVTNNMVKAMIGMIVNQKLETRMYSLFFYSNTFAIATSIAYLLTLGEIGKENHNIAYTGILSLLLSAILLTQSRTCILLLVIAVIAYFIFIGQQTRYKLTKVLLVNIPFSFLYIVLFQYLRQVGNSILIWIITILMVCGSIFFSKIFIKNEKVNKIIKLKILLVVIAVGIILLIILACFKSPLVLFHGKNAQNQITKDIVKVEPNQNYEIKLKLEAHSNTEEDNYQIAFIQRNKYSDEIERKEITVNNCEEEISIDLTTDESVNLIEFNVIAKETNEETELIIKSLTLNEEEFVLNYRFLPTEIINKLKYMKLSQKSVWERAIFIKDGLSIIQQNFLFGIGGGGWQYQQFENQTYYYSASQMHCYLIQVFMEFGIIGAIALISVIITTLKNTVRVIKEKNEIDLPIGMAFLVLLVHGLLDFDIAFLSMLFLFYILVAMLNDRSEKMKANHLFRNIILVSILIISGISIYFNGCEKYVEFTKESRLKKVRTYGEKTALENLYISLVPYNDQYKKERIEYLALYLNAKGKELTDIEREDRKKEEVNLLKQCLEQEKGKTDTIHQCVKILKVADLEEDREYAYKKIEDIFSKHRYDANKIYCDYIELYCLIYGESYRYTIDPLETIKQRENLENNYNYDIDRLLKIICDNIEKDIAYLKEYEKCRVTKEQSEKLIEQIQGEKQ
ncbi:MAG: hypothetical protein HFJ35_07045 [Clostridia bacterium]|nr:hypothetical protein [Clostridia bacterium]